MPTITQWLAKLAKLKVDKARGDPAPHKPLLLLVILEMAEQNELPDEVLPLTPELAFRFCTYWSVVAHRRNQRPDVRYPFYHLKSDGVWSTLGQDGKPAVDRRLTRYAKMPSDFVAFAKDPASRDQASEIIAHSVTTTKSPAMLPDASASFRKRPSSESLAPGLETPLPRPRDSRWPSRNAQQSR
jgi:hypothetical protein